MSKKISEMPDASVLNGIEYVHVVQSAVNKKTRSNDFMHQVAASSGGVNFVAHSEINTISATVTGCTIGGGGGTGTTEKNEISGAGSNWATIAGGYDNIIQGIAATISGGAHNRIALNVDHGVIAGGSTNSITSGSYSTISGGGGASAPNTIAGNKGVISGGGSNSITGNQGVIAGGDSNTINSTGADNVISGGVQNSITGAAEKAVVAGGIQNTISGSWSLIAGGAANSVSGNYSSVFGGNANQANGLATVILGGSENQATQPFAVAFGEKAISSIHGAIAHTARTNNAAGDAQSVFFHMSKETTDATPTFTSVYGSATYADIPDNSGWIGRAQLIAREAATGQVSAWTLPFVCERSSGTASRLYGDAATVTTLIDQLTLPTPTVNINSLGLFRIAITGAASKTIQWSAQVTVSQVI